MPVRKLTTTVDEKRAVTVFVVGPETRANGIAFAYAPGAGSNIHDPFGRFACDRLAARGFTALRFQFPYMEDKRKAPDRTVVLEKTWRAVISEARALGDRLVVGGRSMGGRIASHVVARGEAVDGLVLFAYPLHAPAKPDVWRDTDLSSIAVPTLFCSGTRDSFAAPDELRTVVQTMKRATLQVLDGADHGYAAPAVSGRKREDIWHEAMEGTFAWLKKAHVE